MWSLQTIGRRKEPQYNHSDTTMSGSLVDQIIASQYSLKRKRTEDNNETEEEGNDRKKTRTMTIPSLFVISDIVHHIIAQLFYTPIYFIKDIDNREQEMMTYVPSRYNRFSLRDLFNLLHTCRHMYYIIGKKIRESASLIKSRDNDCVLCHDKTSACTVCKIDYCYRCNAHHYPKATCRYCTKENIICPCIKEDNKKAMVTRNLSLKCYHCRHQIPLVSFK